MDYQLIHRAINLLKRKILMILLVIPFVGLRIEEMHLNKLQEGNAMAVILALLYMQTKMLVQLYDP